MTIIDKLRIKELEHLIKYHRDKYYNSQSEITDAEYDQLEAELTQLDPLNKLLLQVGAKPSYGTTVKHIIPMGSINKKTYDKAGTLQPLYDWYEKHIAKYLNTWKIDGCSGELKYINGKLIESSNRGDGNEGSNITDNILYASQTCKSIPLNIPCPKQFKDKEIIIRGEFYIPKSFFNEKLLNEYKNERNAVSGIIANKNPKDSGNKGINFFAYKIIIDNKEYSNSLLNQLKILKALTFDIVPIIKVDKLNENIIEKLEKQRSKLDFRTDGVVIAIDEFKERDKYGMTGLNKNGIVAFKFKPETALTKIIDIEWSMGRTGKITPVALLNPVDLDGSTVSRVTLHNLAEIKRLDINIGDDVIICKSGDIIPKIIEVRNRTYIDNINYPINCPICGEKTINDNIHVECVNEYCKSKLLKRIIYYLQALNIKNIGEHIVSGLIENKKINNINDLYTITEKDILDIPRCSDGSVKLYFKELNKKNEIQLSDFITSLGISNLGKTNSFTLAVKFKNIENILNLKYDDLINIDGFGDIVVKEIINGLNKHRELINNLKQHIYILPYKEIGTKFKNLNFCCTGKIAMPRKSLQNLIIENGGNYTSIKKGLNYLIIGNGARDHKIEKAKGFNVEVITEDQFLKLIGD